MKQIIILPLIAVAILVANVAPAHALSCLDPESMIEYYVREQNYVIFTAEAGETKEFVRQSADPEGLDPNRQYDDGYTGQYVAVSKAYKGYPEASQWVYFEKNATWGYLCAGAPADAGEEMLYITNQAEGVFELTRVVTTYPVDSAIAQDIIAALEEVTTDAEPAISEVSATDWVNRIRTDLYDMVFIVKIKLTELLFWKIQ